MIDQREEGKNHFWSIAVFPTFPASLARCLFMSLTGASFSDKVDGVHACFSGGDVGQSAAAGGNAGYFK